MENFARRQVQRRAGFFEAAAALASVNGFQQIEKSMTFFGHAIPELFIAATPEVEGISVVNSSPTQTNPVAQQHQKSETNWWFLVLTAVTFSLLGFIIGIWADGFEKLQFIPTLIITPLTFLGGSFYSIDMLPPFWQKVTLFNPVVYLVSGFRWSFYGISDVGVGISLGMTLLFMFLCLGGVAWIFRTGYRLKS